MPVYVPNGSISAVFTKGVYRCNISIINTQSHIAYDVSALALAKHDCLENWYIYIYSNYIYIKMHIYNIRTAHRLDLNHCNGVVMSALASQITSLTIVYLTVYSRRRSKKTSKLRVTGLCAGSSSLTGEFPAQRASYAENVSIWWRHHDCYWHLKELIGIMLTLKLYTFFINVFGYPDL